MLVVLLARQHVLLIGQPGTVKSALVVDLAKIIQGPSYFQWLLTRPQHCAGEETTGTVEKYSERVIKASDFTDEKVHVAFEI